MKGDVMKITAGLLLAVAMAGSLHAETNAALAAQVKARERAFARTMADRDHAAFQTFLADEAVFFGPAGATRGKAAVAAEWKPFFEKPEAPFSWEPETVEVLDSGTLAISSGPVKRPDGARTGSFNSIWRREPDGQWRVVFDKGSP
jgi:ketosteroid isomerase-like protein